MVVLFTVDGNFRLLILIALFCSIAVDLPIEHDQYGMAAFTLPGCFNETNVGLRNMDCLVAKTLSQLLLPPAGILEQGIACGTTLKLFVST